MRGIPSPVKFALPVKSPDKEQTLTLADWGIAITTRGPRGGYYYCSLSWEAAREIAARVHEYTEIEP